MHKPERQGSDLARAWAQALELYPTVPPLRLLVEVDVPGGAGLGSSAAIGVAVLRALACVADQTTSDSAISEAALRWEQVFHGNPSGVDSTMATVGGIATFRRGHGLAPLQIASPIRLVVAHSGEAPSTKAMVAAVAAARQRDTERVDKTFAAIEALVVNAVSALERGDLRALGQLMDMNQMLLGGLMVSTEKLEAMCSAARRAGALGAKLTGGGGGGCMIALVDNDTTATRVSEALRELSDTVFEVSVGGQSSWS